VQSVLKSKESGVFNLSSQNVTVEQVAKIIVQQTSCDIHYGMNDAKPYDFHLDCNLFESTFGKIATTTMKKTVDDLIANISNVNVGRRDNAGS
jgi:hypothetical protein